MSPVVKEGQFNDRLANYVEVKDRIKQFYEKHADGRLVTSTVNVTTEADGKTRVWVEALAYRSADDPLPGHGWSWMELPGTTPYTRGSELENTETSAWGRAIGSLGIGIDKAIATAQEVRNKEAGPARPADAPPSDGSLIGTAEIGTSDADFELRQVKLAPDAEPRPRLAFRLASGTKRVKVEAYDTLAELIAEYRAGIEGYHVTAWGSIREESFTPKDSKRAVTYPVLTLSRLKVGPLDLTEPEPDDAPAEAESIEMGLVGSAA